MNRAKMVSFSSFCVVVVLEVEGISMGEVEVEKMERVLVAPGKWSIGWLPPLLHIQSLCLGNHISYGPWVIYNGLLRGEICWIWIGWEELCGVCAVFVFNSVHVLVLTLWLCPGGAVVCLCIFLPLFSRGFQGTCFVVHMWISCTFTTPREMNIDKNRAKLAVWSAKIFLQVDKSTITPFFGKESTDK